MMTQRKPATDAFLPSGGFDNHFHRGNSNSSMLSPQHFHGFPPGTLPLPDSDVFAPTNPRSDHRHQSYSLYPSDSRLHNTFRGQLSPPSTYDPSLPHLSPGVNGASALYRSVSADAAASPQGTPQLVQKLAQQNSLIREAWEAERNYLEANRRRAEEVYQEERVIMDEVRDGWENEKAAMAREIQALKDRVHRLEGENTALKTVAAHKVHIPGVVSPLARQRGDSFDTLTDPPSGFVLSGHAHITAQQVVTAADASIIPPGLEGASRRPHFSGPGSARPSPTSQPESSPFIPLDPRMQTQESNPKDFLSPTLDPAEGPVPIIDVHELNPTLEGISLRAPAITKSTFDTNEAKPTSPGASPPQVTEFRSRSEPILPPSLTRHGSSKDRTLQVMNAEESRRRTMHAGHTPNHSLSLFPTMSAVGSSTGTGPSERATPRAESVYQTDDTEDSATHEDSTGKEATEGQQPSEYQEVDAASEELLVPQDDVKLSGPIMLRNMPAKDEIFLDQVNKMLDSISKGQDSLPTVMREVLNEVSGVAGSSSDTAHTQQPMAVGGDASHDQPAAEPSEKSASNQKTDSDIPLRMKQTTNFGAPFGMA